MKIKGVKIEGPNEEIIVIPRGEENIVFTARAVLEMDTFEKICPRPKPPTIRHRDGSKVEDINDVRYQERLNDYSSKWVGYLIIKSLEATEGLEWETVDETDPSTWGNYTEELKESGFSDMEVNRIVMGVMNANCLNEKRLDEARRHFLASRTPQNGQLSQKEEALIMQSGEAVND